MSLSVVMICLGILLGFEFEFPICYIYISLVLAILSLTTVYLFKRKNSLKFSIIIGLVLFLLVGMILGNNQQKLEKISDELLQEKSIGIVGEIVPGSIKKGKFGSGFVKINCKSFNFKGQTINGWGQVYLTIKNLPDSKSIISYGKIVFRAPIEKIRGFYNPGVWDMELMHKVKHIHGKVKLEYNKIKFIKSDEPWNYKFYILNKELKAKINKYVSPKDAAILSGMVLGGYDGIDQDVLREFANTGIIHILSVSGSHVALLVSFTMLFLGNLGISKKIASLFAIIIIALYSFICGFSTPVLRSLLMGIALLVGLIIERDADRGAVFSGVLLGLLIYNPLWIFDISFQLSFLSTAGLIYIYPLLKKNLIPDLNKKTKELNRKKEIEATNIKGLTNEELVSNKANYNLKFKLPNFIIEALSVTIAVQITVLPLIIYYFHQISISSLLANLIVVPIIEFIVVIALIGLLFAYIGSFLGGLLLALTGLILGTALRLNSIIANIPISIVNIGHLPIYMAVIYYIMLLVFFKLPKSINLSKWGRKVILATCIFAIIVQCFYVKLIPQPFTTYFLDVGQGDAAIVVTPEKRVIVIDTGGLNSDFDTGSRIVVPALKYLGISKIDVLMLSHGHHDHAGGAAGIAKNMKIEKLMLPREKASNDIISLMHEKDEKTEVMMMKTGDSYYLGKCKIDLILAKNLENVELAGNESSAIVRIAYNGKSFLFTGDATADLENEACNYGVYAYVLKVSHHGSKTSSTPTFLANVNPKLAVISVGEKNRFGHPAPLILQRFADYKYKVLRTDQLGAIKVCLDKNAMAFYSYRYQKEYF